jgi:pimeloyl-ACP methyl ester carboxylesterase
VLSLCSIMSSTGNRTVGQATGEAAALLVGPRPTTPDEAADAAVRASKVFGSKGLPVDEDRVRRLARQAFERMAYPAGFARQLLAVVASGDRTERLGSIDMPTVVIHGTDDGLVQPDGGEATAKAIPGAELVMIEGMGHDLPPSAWPQVTEAILTNIERAGTSA